MMKAFTFRSVGNPAHCGVEIQVSADQAYNAGGLCLEGLSHIDSELHVQLSEDEALELLAWLRRWEGAD